MKDGHAGVIHKYSRFAGAYPPNMWSKGGIRKTPRAPRSRQPQQRARKKKKKVYVLGKACGHLASGSELNLEQQDSRIRLIVQQNGCCTVLASQNIFNVVQDHRIHLYRATLLLYGARVTKSSMSCKILVYMSLCNSMVAVRCPTTKIHPTPWKILVQ